jgi:hypothetical protein
VIYFLFGVRDHALYPSRVHAHAARHLVDPEARAPQPLGLLGQADLPALFHEDLLRALGWQGKGRDVSAPAP